MNSNWFNVIHGEYPGLKQINLTMPIATDEENIGWGTPIYQDGSTWKAATAAQKDDPTAMIYFCVNDQDGLTEAMAGRHTSDGNPVVTGIGGDMVIETTEFDGADTYAIGSFVTVGVDAANDNKAVLRLHLAGDNVVGQVVRSAYTRFANNAVAEAGLRTGANVTVIRVRTLWIPQFTSA